MQSREHISVGPRQVNDTASDEDDYYNYFNYVDNSGSGGGDDDDSAALSSSGTSSYYDYLLPKLDQLTAPTDTLIRDLVILKKNFGPNSNAHSKHPFKWMSM